MDALMNKNRTGKIFKITAVIVSLFICIAAFTIIGIRTSAASKYLTGSYTAETFGAYNIWEPNPSDTTWYRLYIFRDKGNRSYNIEYTSTDDYMKIEWDLGQLFTQYGQYKVNFYINGTLNRTYDYTKTATSGIHIDKFTDLHSGDKIKVEVQHTQGSWNYQCGNNSRTFLVRATCSKLESVVVSNDGNGTAAASVEEAVPGDTVTLSATPNAGYRFKEWQVVSGDITMSANTFTMPESAVEVKAIFEKIVYDITVLNDGNGTASALTETATYGDTVTLTATPNTGYRFKEWQVVVGGASISSNSFSMPAASVTLKAIFEKEIYTVTVLNDGNGSASAMVSQASYGDTVTLSATPNAEYLFKEWQVVSGAVTIDGNSFTMPAGPVEVKAVFERIKYAVTVTNDGNGSASASETNVASGETVTLSADANDMYLFKEWQVISGGVTITDNSFTMPSCAVEIKATFYRHEHAYSSSWTSDETYHWHAAECALFDECSATYADKAEHSFEDGVCSVCDYVCLHEGRVLGICPICGQDLGSDDIDVVVEGDVSSSAQMEDVKKAVDMTPEEIEDYEFGDEFKTVVEVNDINENKPAEDVVNQIEETASKKGFKESYYLDIKMNFVNVTEGTSRSLSEISENATITVQIPKGIQRKNSSYGIVRYHDGAAEILPSKYDSSKKTLTFSTNKFSVYVIVRANKKSDDNGDYLEPLRSYLTNIVASGEPGGTVVWEEGTGLPYDIMQLIKKADVIVEFKYIYQDIQYDVLIDKSNVPEVYEDWYGPLYIAGLNSIGTTTEAGGDYTVVEGDTLGSIAARFNTTVEAIASKNEQIKNVNLIYPGQKLNV